jgi:hypothetical protein
MDLLEEKKIGKCNMSSTQYTFFNKFGNEFTNLDLCAKGSINSYNIFIKTIFINGTCPLGAV